MLPLLQSIFAEPENLRSIGNERLVIHQRTSPSAATHLAIFVHGLGGSRYGKRATWGDFPRLIFEEFPTVDVGMYSYRTFFRRVKFWRSTSLPNEAAALGDLIGSLDQYQSFILLGHSMGGILCKGSVVHLVTGEQADTIQKISGIFLMASPQLGSTKLPGLLSLLSKDARVLKAHNRYLADIETVFRDHIHCGLSYPLEEKHHIPCWALIAADDYWVDRLSAGIGLGANQRTTIGGSHTEIVKPKSKTDDGFRFVRSCIQRAILHGEKPKRKHECRPARIEELPFINELAVRLFGNEVSSLQLMQEWWRINPNIFWILRRVTTAPAYRNEEVVGYFCVLPVVVGTGDQIRKGELTGATIPPSSIVPPAERCETVYVGAIAGTDMRSKAFISLSLTTHLEQLASSGPLEVLTRPVTADGLRLVEGEMTPVTDSGLGHVYHATLGMRTR